MLFFYGAAYLECYQGVQFKSYAGISLINFSAYIKAGSSLIKYMYQMYENVKNKSTEGVSSWAYITDLAGTIFCFAQL